MSGKMKTITWVGIILGLALIVWAVRLKKGEVPDRDEAGTAPATEPAGGIVDDGAAVPQDASDAGDEAGAFDFERYEKILHQSGKTYQESMNQAEKAAREIEAYEQARNRETPERAAIADEIDELTRQLSVREKQLSEKIKNHPRWKETERELEQAREALVEIRSEIADRIKAQREARMNLSEYEAENVGENAERSAVAAEIEKLREQGQALFLKVRSEIEEIPEWRELSSRRREVEQQIAAAQSSVGEDETGDKKRLGDLVEEQRRLILEMARLERERQAEPEHGTFVEDMNALQRRIRSAENALSTLYQEDEPWRKLKEAATQARERLEVHMEKMRAAALAEQKWLRARDELEKELANEIATDESIVAEIEALRRKIEEKTEALRQTFADDPDWEELNSLRMEAEKEREAGLERVRSLIRQRMRAQTAGKETVQSDSLNGKDNKNKVEK